MAGIVETDLVFFSGVTGGSTNCDSITDWSPAVTLDTELKVQGTGCVGIKVSNTSSLITFSISGTVNLTSTMIYFWAMFADPLARLATKAAGGLGIRIQSSAADYVEWYIAGKDTWSGGWRAFAIHTDAPGDVSGGSVNKAAINAISIRWKTIATAKVSPNCYWDAIRFGKALRIRSGSSSDPATFDDFITAENDTTNKWGILERVEGVLFSQGRIQIGSPTSGQQTYFKDESEVLIFKELPNTLPSDYYQLEILGNPSTFTTVYIGSEVGDSGVSGCAFRPGGAPKYKVLADDQYISTIGLYGSSFYDPNTIRVSNTFDTAHEVENTSFESGNIVIANVCKFRNCNFISADSIACSLPLNHNVEDSSFINNSIATYFTTSGTTTFTNLTFSGNVYDVEFTGVSGQTLTINQVNSNADATKLYTPNGGTIILLTAVNLTVYVKDATGNPIQNARVYIERQTDNAQLMNELTDANGMAQEAYNYTGDVAVEIDVRKSSPGATRYFPSETFATITSSGLTLYVTLQKDEIASQ